METMTNADRVYKRAMDMVKEAAPQLMQNSKTTPSTPSARSKPTAKSVRTKTTPSTPSVRSKAVASTKTVASPKRGPGRDHFAPATSTKAVASRFKKPWRWAPGQLQAKVIAELKMGPHTRADLFKKFKTTGTSSIVAALKAPNIQVEGNPKFPQKLVYTYVNPKTLGSTTAQPVLRELGSFSTLERWRASEEAARRRAPPASAKVDGVDITAGADVLQAAKAFSEARKLIEDLPENKKAFALALSSLIDSGKITLKS